LKAMKKIKESKLLIVGDGPQKNELEDYARNNQLKNVDFVGKKDGHELMAIMKNAKFVVVPSQWYDNSPLVIYEAFSMGKPVIGSNIGGIPELVDHKKNGLLFEMGNVDSLTNNINYLLTNQNIIINFGKEARKKAELEFHPEVHYDKIYNLYLQLLSRQHKVNVA